LFNTDYFFVFLRWRLCYLEIGKDKRIKQALARLYSYRNVFERKINFMAPKKEKTGKEKTDSLAHNTPPKTEDGSPLKISSVLLGIAAVILMWLISIAIFK
jgi:hypothetical protein